MNDSPISLNDIKRIIIRRKWMFFIPMTLIVAAGISVALTLPPWFRSEATILIEEQEIPSNFVIATVTSYAEQRLQVIHQRIMSYSQLIELINRFDLYVEKRSKLTIEEVVEKMREEIDLNTIDAKIIDPRTGKPATATIAFKLSYIGKDPDKVHKVTSALTSLFLEENLNVRTRQTMETSKFLEDELNKVKSDLEAIDKKISDFKEKHINSLPEFINVNMQLFNTTEQNIDRLNERIKNCRERESYYLTQLSAISPELEYNTGQKRLDELKFQLVSLRSRFSDEYPDIVRTKIEIEQLEKRMAVLKNSNESEGNQSANPMYLSISSQLAGVQTDINSLKQQIAVAKKKRELYQLRIEETPGIEGEYQALIMEQSNTNAKYNDLMQKLMEAKVAHGLEKEQKGEKFTLIDPARYPEKPFKPNRMIILAISIILGIGVGIGFLLVIEITDDSVRNAGMLSSATALPVLAGIPYIKTLSEKRRSRIKYILLTISVFGVLITAVALFHFYIMDLDIFWAKVMRKLAT